MLKVENLTSAYGRIEAIKGISLEVQKGEIVTLVGGNGAGKTTLLRAISGVQPVTGGRILFEDQDITKLSPHARVAKAIAQVPEGRQIFGPLTIEDNLRLGAYRRNGDKVEKYLERIFGIFPVLKERRRTIAAGLSGGQQQMLAIGRALMSGPKLLLLDEPSMGLAPILVDQILDAVKFMRDEGATIFLVEQNAFAALRIADRGYVIETGQITMSGSGRELLADDRIKSAYLGI